MPEGFDVAQICLNGHVINSTTRNMPEFSKEFCDKCGEKTTTVCPNCGKNIQGDYWGSAVTFSEWLAPVYCIHCGKPFEWTNRKVNSAKELVTLSGSLDKSSIDILIQSIDDLVKKTNQEVAKIKFKRLIVKIEPEISKGIKESIFNILDENIRHSLW